MDSVFVKIVDNIALIFVLTYIYSLLRAAFSTLAPDTKIWLNGILLGLIAIIGVSFPITIAPGIFFDGRGIIIGIATIFGGWRTGTIAALFVIGYRMILGGAGIVPTISASALHVLVGMAFQHSAGLAPQTIRGRDLLIAGIGLGCNVLISIAVFLPPELAATTLSAVAVPLMVTYPVGTLLIGTLLKFQIRQHESQRQLRIGNAAIKFGRDGILTLDLRGRLLLGNRAAAQLLGYASEAALPTGKPIYEWVAPAEGQRLASYLSLLMQNETPEQTQPITVNIIRTDGGTFPADCAGAPIHNGITGFVLSLRDISKFKQAEDAAVALALEQQKVQILRGFIGDASHDLRTPLALLNTSVYLLDKYHDKIVEVTLKLLEAYGANDINTAQGHLSNLLTMTSRARETGKRLEQNIEHLNRLVDDLLNMAQLDQMNELPLVPRQINTLIAPLIQNFRLLAETRQQTLTYIPAETLPLVLADETSIERILLNLVTNATKYTPEGGVISVRTAHDGETVIIEVSDNGIGIPAEALPHIFDRFFRVDKARSVDTGSVGLGLSIVKRLVELHGGTITVESSPQTGSVFYVRLPALAGMG